MGSREKLDDAGKENPDKAATGEPLTIDQTVDKMASDVSKQVSKQAISGSHQKAAWISKTNTLYVLVAVNPEIIKNAMTQTVQTSMRNEKAMWQQFQAKKGFEELEKEIDKEFGQFSNE